MGSDVRGARAVIADTAQDEEPADEHKRESYQRALELPCQSSPEPNADGDESSDQPKDGTRRTDRDHMTRGDTAHGAHNGGAQVERDETASTEREFDMPTDQQQTH